MPRRSSQSRTNGQNGNGGSASSGAAGFFSELREGLREGFGLDEPNGGAPGYEVEKVCTGCLGMLQGE